MAKQTNFVKINMKCECGKLVHFETDHNNTLIVGKCQVPGCSGKLSGNDMRVKIIDDLQPSTLRNEKVRP